MPDKPEMLPVWKIGAIAAGGFVLLVVSSVVAWIILKQHHDRWMARSRDEERRLYQEDRFQGGTLGGHTEPHLQVPQSQPPLRRSIHLPYGLIAQGWSAISSRESLNNQPPMSSTPQAPRSRLKRDRSRHPLTLPRSVRLKKSDKVIALVHLQQRSPLSAITERSQTNSVASPDLNFVTELPTHITPKTTPEKDERSEGPDGKEHVQAKMGRPASKAWPLPRPQRPSSLQTAELVAPPDDPYVSHARPPMGQRNASITSQTSGTAPNEAVPPLPQNIPVTRYPNRRNSKLRISTASIETSGSSILGDLNSASQADTDFTSISLASPPSNSQARRGAQDPGFGYWDASSFTRLGSPPGRQTMRGLRMKQVSHGSFAGEIGHDNLQRMGSTGQATDARSQNGSTRSRRSASNSLQVPPDTLQWPDSRNNPLRSPDHLPIPGQAVRGEPLRHSSAGPMTYRSRSQRHSMFDGLIAKSNEPLRNISGNHAVPPRSQKRPASVTGTVNGLFQWDQSTLQNAKPSTTRDVDSSRRGHKRQNCVRISNIPPITIGSAPHAIPPTVEESEESPQKVKIPGLILLESSSDGNAPSIPKFAPKLPTWSSRGRYQPQPVHQAPPSLSPRVSSFRTGECEDDIFSSRPDSRLSTLFQISDTTQWPFVGNRISQSRVSLRSPNTLPLSLSAGHDPSPELATSPPSFHFSRSLHLQPSPCSSNNSPSPSSRSGHGTPIHGPHNPLSSHPNSRTSTPLPLSKPTPQSRIPRSGSGRELHRSVMLLRRMNSDANSPKSRNTRASNLYMNMGALPIQPYSYFDGVSPNGIALKSPASVGAGSVWEDASLNGSPSPTALKFSESVEEKKAGRHRAGTGTEIWNDSGRILSAKNPFATPQGKGLGLMAWGTPGSLYDRDGFLKE